MSDPITQPTNGPELPTRTFRFALKFESGKVGAGEIKALDHISALVKLCAWMADQPERVVHLDFVDTMGQVIVPGFQPPRRG